MPLFLFYKIYNPSPVELSITLSHTKSRFSGDCSNAIISLLEARGPHLILSFFIVLKRFHVTRDRKAASVYQVAA